MINKVTKFFVFFAVCIELSLCYTYRMFPNENACFYGIVSKPGEKVGFYFAVQSGGAFDIDFEVTGPNDKIILNGFSERQGEYVFTSQLAGDHKFCFSNTMSTFAEKMVDFEINIEHELKESAPLSETSEQVLTPMEQSLNYLANKLNVIQKYARYFRTRQNRNHSTVVSTESKVFWFALFESILIVTMSVLQVVFIRKFFSSTKGRI